MDECVSSELIDVVSREGMEDSRASRGLACERITRTHSELSILIVLLRVSEWRKKSEYTIESE